MHPLDQKQVRHFIASLIESIQVENAHQKNHWRDSGSLPTRLFFSIVYFLRYTKNEHIDQRI